MKYLPFSLLPESTVDSIAKKVQISYFRANADIYNFGDEIHDLCVIRSGSVELYRRNGELYDRLSEGCLFGQMGLLMNNIIRLPSKALEDTLIYFIPESCFKELCEQFDDFSYFVELDDHSRLNQGSAKQVGNNLMSSKISSLALRPPVSISCFATVHQAAMLMTSENVSSLLVSDFQVDLPERIESAVGIVTDRDLRTRVLAAGLSQDALISSVMSTDLISIDDNSYVFEAMIHMLRHNLHHLPVTDQLGHPSGVIATSDIVRYQSHSSIYIVSSIFRQKSVNDLARLSLDVQQCFVRMVNDGANSHMIGSAISMIGRSFKQRLLELAELELGVAPISYCFLALGSMARDEQLVITDQDNALILDNSYDPKLHGKYFSLLADFVCKGLAECGYSYCRGGIMASNECWQMTRLEWEHCFSDWIDNPDSQALLNCSIFFDLDGVWGKTEWADQLNAFTIRKIRENSKILGCLARNALNRTPPLGFFKNFVMEQDGQQFNTINLKRRGTAPLVDLIRIYALSIGSRSQNSFERLNDLMNADVLTHDQISNIKEALEFISTVRIRHQACEIELGDTPNNTIQPESLSNFEKNHLKEAFKILSDSQRHLKHAFPRQRN
jgi:CBS domain-containing protein